MSSPNPDPGTQTCGAKAPTRRTAQTHSPLPHTPSQPPSRTLASKRTFIFPMPKLPTSAAGRPAGGGTSSHHRIGRKTALSRARACTKKRRSPAAGSPGPAQHLPPPAAGAPTAVVAGHLTAAAAPGRTTATTTAATATTTTTCPKALPAHLHPVMCEGVVCE